MPDDRDQSAGDSSESSEKEAIGAEEEGTARGADMLLDIFEAETVEDPYLRDLADGLESVDIFELLDQCKVVASRIAEFSRP